MKYIKHLKDVDKEISKLIDKYGEIDYIANDNVNKDLYFKNLVKSIIGRQLSIKSAKSIEVRVYKYLNY